MLTRTKKPAEAQEPAAVESLAQVRAEAEGYRRAAAANRAEAEVTVSTAQAQAERLVAEAEQRAHALTADAAKADRTAEPLEERAAYLAGAQTLREQIADAEKDVVRLSGEADALREQISGLGGRLTELGGEREETGVQLAAAREQGDVDAVTKLRARLAAIDEVAAVLQGRQKTTQDRVDAVGKPDSTGELADAARHWQRLQSDLRGVLNWLDPDRPEAVHDKLVAELEATLAANAQRIAEECKPPSHSMVIRNR